jgi:Flp pilus assembly protein TadB
MMVSLLGAVIGLLAAGGIWVIVAGIRGIPEHARRSRLPVNWKATGIKTAAAAGVWAVVWAVTSWPMAGLVGAGVVATVPMLIEARQAKNAALAKTEALATWAEMLRDTIAAHAGLNNAVAATARVAPAPIRAPLRTLAVRAEHQGLSPALRQFAAEVADPVADLIVAALVIADERQARNLTDLLGEIAASARAQAAMRLRVETGRARTYASAQALVAITLGLVVVLLTFSPSVLEPYDTAAGQVVLGVVGGLFVGALWTLVQLGRPALTPRLLAGIEAQP